MNADRKELTSEIRDLVTQMKNVEADVSLVKNVNEKLVNQLIETERQSLANAQYSSRECLEVVRIPAPIPNDLRKLMSSRFLINLEFIAIGKTVFRFFVSRKTSNIGSD